MATTYRILKDFSDPACADDGALIAAVAAARGESNVERFIADEPEIENPIRDLTGYKPFVQAMREILPMQGSVLIYGDYDCDGITSSVIIHDLLLALGFEEDRIRHFIPDRFCDGYGLTEKGWKSANAAHGDPGLLITVDCGTPSGALIKTFTFATLVIDHHDFDGDAGQHPALAHLNPKAETGSAAEPLTKCCAAGLAFLLSEAVAEDLEADGWNRDRALILGGLGTLVDVMPLVGVNRALVKHSLRLANLSSLAKNVPGLAALKESAGTERVDRDAYGFQWGPRINACGRLAAASPALELLLAQCPKQALAISARIEEHFQGNPEVNALTEGLANRLSDTNQERKVIQKKVLEEALEKAIKVLDENPDTSVLVLHAADWHTGVVGIVAARIRETFHRPSIVLGRWPERNGPWKGSGRSIPEYDLGAGVRAAAAAKILLGGGGHPMAAGMSINPEDKIKEFQTFMNERCTLNAETFTPAYEILGPVEGKNEREWWGILQKLEPFGQGHAQLYFKLKGAVLKEKEVKGKTGNFVILSFDKNGQTHRVSTNSETANQLNEGACLDLVVSLSMKAKNASNVYYNWTLVDWE